VSDQLERTSEPLRNRVVAGLQKIGLAMKSRAWKEANRRKVTPLQGQTLALLRMRFGDEATVSALAQELAVALPTASDVIRTLEEKGWVRKSRSKADRRVRTVTLTAAGMRKADRGAGWPDFLAAAADQLPVAEQESLLRILVKMIRTLQERNEIPVARMCVTCRYFRPRVYANPERPHHCDYVNAPFGDRLLRLDCAEHAPAATAQAERNWKTFNQESRP